MKKLFTLAFLIFAANLFAAYPSFKDMTNYVVPVVTALGTKSTNYADSVLNAATNYSNLGLNAATNYANSVLNAATNYSNLGLNAATNYANSVLNAATNFTILATNSLAGTNYVNALRTNFSSTSLQSSGTPSLSVITNGAVVWFYTNAIPAQSVTAPVGSLMTVTNGSTTGFLYFRTTNGWYQIK